MYDYLYLPTYRPGIALSQSEKALKLYLYLLCEQAICFTIENVPTCCR